MSAMLCLCVPMWCAHAGSETLCCCDVCSGLAGHTHTVSSTTGHRTYLNFEDVLLGLTTTSTAADTQAVIGVACIMWSPRVVLP